MGTPPCTHVLWFFKRGCGCRGVANCLQAGKRPLQNDSWRTSCISCFRNLTQNQQLKMCPHSRWFRLPLGYNGFFSCIFSTTGKPRPNNGLVLQVPPRSVSVLFANGKLNWKAPSANLHSCQPIIGWIVRKTVLCFWHGRASEKGASCTFVREVENESCMFATSTSRTFSHSPGCDIRRRQPPTHPGTRARHSRVERRTSPPVHRRLRCVAHSLGRRSVYRVRQVPQCCARGCACPVRLPCAPALCTCPVHLPCAPALHHPPPRPPSPSARLPW